MAEYAYRWVRTHSRSTPDDDHVKKMEAQGWEPVPLGELPPPAKKPDGHWHLPELLDPHAFGVEYGGLRLYRIPTEILDERRAYFAKRNASYMQSSNFSEAGVADDERDNLPTVTAAEYYSAAACAEHPERASELAEYRENLKVKGVAVPIVLYQSGMLAAVDPDRQYDIP